VLMRSTPKSWKVSKDADVTTASFQPPATGTQSYPLMVLVKGQFPDAFEGKDRPEWPKPATPNPRAPVPPADKPAADITPAPAKLIVLGCSEMFRRDFLSTAGNVDLFLNSVDAVTLGDDIVNVRGRKPVDRLISLPEPCVRQMWKVLNYGLANLVIAAVGVATAVARRSSRNRYTIAQVAAGAVAEAK